MVPFGRAVTIHKDFRIVPGQDYRANVIGYSRPGQADEAGVTLARADLKREFSVDKAGSIFRIEIYKGEKFCGMILAAFSPETPRVAKAGGDKLLARLRKAGTLDLGR